MLFRGSHLEQIGLFEREKKYTYRMDKARDCVSSRDASSRAKVYF